MANQTESRTAKVGLLVAISLLTLMTFLFFIGSEKKIFSRKYEYQVLMDSAAGLAQGNPVQLSGVTIGSVRDIHLPRDPENERVEITVMVDRKFADRIRQDSRARIRKLGLIAADSYVDITPGSPEEPVLPPGSVIPSQRATDVDKLITSGEDLVDNFVQISYSLKNVLQRIDRGEGLIGELTTEPTTKQRITDTLLTTLNRTNSILVQVESGDGVIGKLVYDDTYAEDLTGSLGSAARSMQSVTANLEESFRTGEGVLPALLSDPEGRQKVHALIDQLNTTSANLAIFSAELREGEGLLPRLLSDREYADETLQEFHLLVSRLSDTARMLQSGEGTAGRLIADPSIYEAINDVLIGINESRMLRWLIRNRQQKGIETRSEAIQETPSPAPIVEKVEVVPAGVSLVPAPAPEPPEPMPEQESPSAPVQKDPAEGSGQEPAAPAVSQPEESTSEDQTPASAPESQVEEEPPGTPR